MIWPLGKAEPDPSFWPFRFPILRITESIITTLVDNLRPKSQLITRDNLSDFQNGYSVRGSPKADIAPAGQAARFCHNNGNILP